MAVQVATAQNVGVDYEVAGIGDRIAAQLIDYAIYLFWLMVIGGTGALLESLAGLRGSFALFMVCLILPVVLYPLLCEYFLDGQTFGKKALKIKVVSLDGSTASLSSYLLRYVFIIIDISLFFGLVAVLTILINGKGQRLGDLAAGTTVIRLGRKVRLEEIALDRLPDDYRVKHPEAGRLSDRDVTTVRRVLARNDEDLEQLTAERVASFLQIEDTGSPRQFLHDILADHQYVALAESNPDSNLPE